MKKNTLNEVSSTSLDVREDLVKRLLSVVPEAETDGKIDWVKLQQELTGVIDESPEKYNFTWNGKKQAMKLAQLPSTATLKPNKQKSKEWDTTENIYIEGDNLEALKLLQKSYANKIKLIYVDPPYNTGKDFVYKDNFKDSLANYLEQTGQVDSTGNKLSVNTDSSGRYHTDWLNMMYPRLKLARNLLTDEGVIFISIDENEQENLAMLCNEIFGEENKVSTIANISNPKGRSDSKYIATGHEYILIYSKNINKLTFGGFKLDEKITKRYNKIDSDGRKYRETDLKKGGFGDKREDRPAMFYYFSFNTETGELRPTKNENPDCINIKPIRADGTDGRWRWGYDTAEKNTKNLIARKMTTKDQWSIYEKDYLDKRDEVKAPSYWSFKDINNERGVESFTNLGFSKETFDNPKPIGTILRAIRLACGKDTESLVLDFFSGSSTTAEAVMSLNSEDGGNRKFIMVQLPEQLTDKDVAFIEGYQTIPEIAQERIRRSGDKIVANNPLFSEDLDIGFKVFELDKSNIKKWNADSTNLVDQIGLLEDNFEPESTPLDVVYEVILKQGLSLTSNIVEKTLDDSVIYTIEYGSMFVVLGENINSAASNYIVEMIKDFDVEDSVVVFQDQMFENDSEKLNAIEILNENGVKYDNVLSI